MTSSAMMAAAETLASVASAGPSSPAKDRLASSSKSQARRSDASEPAPEPKKRTRPVSACEACRAKKVRCLLSPDAPVCQNCLASGKECLFRVDDLAPALRAARFAHCGPPSANARTIAFKKSSKATPRKSREDTDESSRPKPLKRKRSEAESEASDSKDKDPQPSASSAAKPKAKAVFRSFANPNNLAAPLPVPATPTYIKNLSFTSSTMASPPSKHTHTHSSRIPSSFSSASRRRSESASTHNASTVRDTSTIAHLNHRFSHPAIGDPHGAYVESFVPSHDPSHYGHPVDTTAASGSTPVGGPSFFLQQHSPSNASVFSNRSVRSSTMYAASRPLNPPPLDSFRPRRKSSAASPRRLPNQLVDPMSLEYYGHPSDATTVDRYEAFDRPPLIHRVPSGITAEPPHRDVSAELRNGIEKWQRNGTARLGDEHETTKVQVQVQEEHVAQPRPKIVLPFFRWFGTTANTPGYRKIKVGVLQDSEVPGTDELAPALEANGVAENAASFGLIVRDDDQRHSCTSAKPLEDSIVSPHSAQLASPGTRFENKASSSVTRELFEINRPRYPRKDILEHLVSRFLTHFKPSWCPWIEAEELKNGVENGSMPAILANAVCAVAARFSDRPELRKVPRKSSGDHFSEMAKILIIPLLSFPSIEVIEALILLSYAEFAAGSDSGLWMYVGMALRMAQDLGLQHEASIQSIANDKQQDKARLLFWAVIGLDRITTFGTGRPVSIRESEIDTELPTLSEMSDMKDETVIFGHVVRILMLRGRMGELLNRREREESPISAEEGKRDLTRMWFELAQSYSDLPANLHFNVQTFQKSAAHDQSPGFVYLHVLFQSTIGLLDRPALIKKFTGDSVPLLPSFAPAASAAASRTIADILTLGDAFDDRCIIASPYLDQLVLPAGRSFLAERQAAREALRSLGHGTTPASSRPPSRGAAPNQQHSRTSHLVSTKSYAEINLGACQRILQKLQQYWAGASWPLRALEQEAAGNGDEIDPQASDEDAQSAPIRDIEMVLKWAKSRIRSKKRLERSSHATPKPDTMTLSEPMEGMNGILTSNTGSDEFASTHSGDSPFGLGISAGLTFDIDALMGSWQMDHFDPVSNFHASTSLEHSVTPQAGAQTPYPATATNLAGGQMYLSPGGRKSSLSTPSQPPPPPQAMAASPHRTHSRNTSFYRPPSPSPPQQEQEQEHANPASSNALSAVSANHAATPGLLDTSSLAIAEFFSHDQSIWPLSIQNDDLDQDAVNVIASAMQLPTTASGYLANALL